MVTYMSDEPDRMDSSHRIHHRIYNRCRAPWHGLKANRIHLLTVVRIVLLVANLVANVVDGLT
jgi:hypothetical protein